MKMSQVQTISRKDPRGIRSGILRDHTPDSPNGTGEKRWSDLHGDMQRPAEMSGPPWQAALVGGVTKCLR